ncbi:MAG TPA: pseudouridine synthase [Chromatiales bacterium]|nr:pseudouridine synthase [Chromatiales bacterium]
MNRGGPAQGRRAAPAPTEKLQKILARAGFGSRREIERWIEAGRVQVNGRSARLGDRARAADAILLDGRPVDVAAPVAEPARVLIYHKPAGEVTTRHDPEGRPTVFRTLPPVRNGRWIVVGRLDFNTLGLMLFTTDGELAHRLMHPSTGLDREYAVRILGDPDALVLERLLRGVDLDDGPARFEAIAEGGARGANHWYHVVVREGRRRLVRRLWESQGFPVSRLIRVRFGPLALPRGLPAGRWRECKPEELQALCQAAGLGVSGAASRKASRPASKSVSRATSKASFITPSGSGAPGRRRRGGAPK